MPTPQEKIYTLEDIFALPAGERAELVDGQIFYMAPPSRKHQDLAGELFGLIREYIKANKGDCKPYIAPFAVFLNEDDKTYVEPDISVICDRSKLTDRGCNGAPEWIIEIVSPSTRKMDYGLKMSLYMQAGVQEYWIVDPIRESVTVYTQVQDWAPMIFRFTGKIQSAVINGLEIDFDQLDIE